MPFERIHLPTLPDPHFGLEPKADDLAEIFGMPEKAQELVKFRYAKILSEVVGVAAFGMQTHGALAINTMEGLLTYGAGELTSFVNTHVSNRRYWKHYREFIIPWLKFSYSLPNDFNTELQSEQINSGIRSFYVGESETRLLGIKSGNPVLPTIVSGLISPLVQVGVAASYVGLTKASVGLAIAYSGLAAGKFFQKTWHRLESEHTILRDAIKRAASLRHANAQETILEGTKSIQSNISGYERQGGVETTYETTPRLVLLGALAYGALTGNIREPFGLSSFFNSVASSSHVLADVVKSFAERRISHAAAKVFADFVQTRFVSEYHWDKWRKTKDSRPNTLQDNGQLIVLEDFTTDFEGKDLPGVSHTFKAGMIYHLIGSSGDGKSALCYAMSADRPHKGTMYLADDSNRLVDIKTLSREAIQSTIVHFTPDYFRSVAGRPTDFFKDAFIKSVKKQDPGIIEENPEIIAALIMNDSDLELQLDLYKGNAGDKQKLTAKVLGKLDPTEIQTIQNLRSQRADYVRSCLNALGSNMEHIDMHAPISELSSGMLARLFFASTLESLGDDVRLVIFDEPLRALDVGSATELVRQIALLTESRPKMSVMIISHTHDEIIREIAHSTLGDDKLQTIRLNGASI